MSIRIMAAVLAVSLLAGCATGYHSASSPLLGWTGGFWDSKGPGELTIVGFGGNGYIKQDKVAVYLLYRCAELTQQQGKTHFRIFDSLITAVLDRPLDRAFVSPVTGKPLGQVYMLLEGSAVPGAFSAADVLAQYQAEVKGAQQP